MIIFLDDEPRYSDKYVAELCLEWNTRYTDSVDEALQLLREARPSEVELLILDIMMPPRETFGDEETRDGLDTGIHFFDLVRRGYPKLPVIVLTNVTEKTVARKFESEPNCWFRLKRDCLPDELAEVVREALQVDFVM